MTYPGGWTCASTSAVEQQASGRVLGGCERRGASFDIYKARKGKPPGTSTHQRPTAGGVGQAWHVAARHAGFPVYRPRATRGLPFDGVRLAPHSGCLTANWGDPKSSKGPHFGLYEPGDSARCGQPGEATQVATTEINGVEVEVLVQCPRVPRCSVEDGQTDGEFLLFVPEPGPDHYTIQLDSTHLPLNQFLEVARSFTRVR